jgi:hypothetical protein
VLGKHRLHGVQPGLKLALDSEICGDVGGVRDGEPEERRGSRSRNVPRAGPSGGLHEHPEDRELVVLVYQHKLTRRGWSRGLTFRGSVKGRLSPAPVGPRIVVLQEISRHHVRPKVRTGKP